VVSFLKTDLGPHAKCHLCVLIIVLLAGYAVQLSGEDATQGYTVDGKGVVLREDGTWEYSGKIGFFDIEKSGITRINEISIADLLPCTIIEVIDGDTIKVVFVDPPPGIQQEESIRLLGIDAPELHTSINPEPLATEAREFVIAHTADPTVYLAFESRWRGSFGRILAYVFTNEKSLLNADLLSSGLASVYVETPCYFHQYFVTLEVAARSESRGMWTTPMNSSIVIRQIFNDGRSEYVELWNRSDQTVDLSGWYLLDDQRNRIDIPLDTSIPTKGRFYILSGTGTTPPSTNYVYPTKTTVWNNRGDRARLYDEEDELVTEHGY
jgi:endonuclease YncB( thermonuclease family)